MKISDWPEHQRPREKLLEKGPHSLADAELLALFLQSGTAGSSAVQDSARLLTHFGSLRGLLTAPRDKATAGTGIGPARYALLQAALELSRRHLAESLKSAETLTSPDLTRRFLLARLRDLPHELFCCLLLDNRHRVLDFEELFRGTIDGASVYPREVVKLALARNAAAIIFAHNHPSGVAEPSLADQSMTRRLKDALALVDIRVLDHFVVGDGQCVSFAERGLL